MKRKKERLSRRDFLRGLSAGATAMAVTGLLGGCGASSLMETEEGTGGASAPSVSVSQAGDAGALLFCASSQAGVSEATAVFAELFSEATSGELSVMVYTEDQIGEEKEILTAVRNGELSMAVVRRELLLDEYPDFYLYDMPYLFFEREEAVTIGLSSEPATRILEAMAESGELYGLALWEEGFLGLANQKREVGTISSCRGLVLRRMENAIHRAAWEALGVTFSEEEEEMLSEALSEGRLDGWESDLISLAENGWAQLLPYITRTEHLYRPLVVVINAAFYDALSEEEKEILCDCLAQAGEQQRTLAEESEEEAAILCEEAGAGVLSLSGDVKAELFQTVVDAGVMELVQAQMIHPEYLQEMLKLL